jgi:hypothetical protein
MQVNKQVCRKLIGLQVYQTGNPRLSNAEEGGGLVLRHSARLNEPAEAIHQLGAGLEMLRALDMAAWVCQHIALAEGSYGSTPSSF